MNVNVFKLRLVHNSEQIKAIACITIGEVAINDIRVVELPDGKLLVNMPSRQDNSGKLRDTAHPTTTSLREQIRQTILRAYTEALNNETTHNLEE